MGVVPTYLTGMVWGCPSLLLARCCEILWRKVQYRKKCTRKEIHQLNLKMMSVGAPQEYKYGWNLTKVAKIKSLLILHSGGIHLTSDPFPVIGKDFNGSWTKPLSISEGSCYFFFFKLVVLLFVILKVLRSNGLYHPHASVLNTTMQCWPWSRLTLTVLVECLLLWSVYATK